MKNFITKIALLSTVFMVLLSGCATDKSLEELSKDPNNPSKITPALLLTSAQTSVLGSFGKDYDRYAGAFVQTFAGNHATGVDADRYNLRPSDFETTFKNLYKKGLKDCKVIINEAGKESNAYGHIGVAKVLMATGLGYLTSVYGDIPYSECFADELNPVYDSQEDIYAEINNLLTGALEDFEKTSDINVGVDDLVFNGDMNKWKAVAYTLLARYNNHFSNKSSYDASLVLSYVDKAKALGTVSYVCPFDDKNSQWVNPWYDLYRNNLIVASEKFIGRLSSSPVVGDLDPRLYAYFNHKNVDGVVVNFSGKMNGLPTGSESYSPVGDQTFFGKVDSPLYIAPYYELLYIEAEAALISGDEARSKAALKAALQVQFDMLKDVILAHSKDYFINNLGLAVTEDQVANYIQSKIDGYITGASANASLKTIMSEKYVAMFTVNIETWNDLRRYDFAYPESYFTYPAESKLGEKFIERALYPLSETQTNTSTPEGVLMTDELWIFSN